MTLSAHLTRLCRILWGDWQTNELWQRTAKATIGCMVTLIVSIIPGVVAVYGANTYLIPFVAVFSSPAHRTAKLVELLLLVLLGSLVGIAWSLLGLYLSTLAVSAHLSSTIRALFFLVVVLVHGFVRSSTPRLFVSVWLLLVSSATVLIGSATRPSLSVFTSIYYPILTGAAIVLFVNISIFPEMSSSYLGSAIIETLADTVHTVDRATYWFVTPGGDSAEAKKKQAEARARDREKSSNRKKTWLRSFLADFPNPFKNTANKRAAELAAARPAANLTTLAGLTGQKAKMRAALLKCGAAQDEVNFEYSISPLPPYLLKPVSKRYMQSLVENAVTIIGACENKYVLLNAARDADKGPPARPVRSNSQATAPLGALQVIAHDESDENRIDMVKPLREIESADADLLEPLIQCLRRPVEEFREALDEAAFLVMTCIAYCYDAPQVPLGAQKPAGIMVEEVDLRIGKFTDALARFDERSASELKMAAMGEAGQGIDLMPRMETFLLSSFLLGFRQAATHVLHMLHHSRQLVDQRRKRHDRSRFWLPHYADIGLWLSTAGEMDHSVLPENARKEVRTGKKSKPVVEPSSSEEPSPSGSQRGDVQDEGNSAEASPPDRRRVAIRDTPKPPRPQPTKAASARRRRPWIPRTVAALREGLADALEWAQHSDDLMYAVKLAIAVMAVSWPSFVPSCRTWYADVHGIWAPLQLVLVFEVSIGTSIFIVLVRLFGVVFGCVMGYLSYEISGGNRIGMAAAMLLGIVPSSYIQQGTRYVKAGIISITSMCVVALTAMNQSGTAYENFYKRLSAFLIGSVVAIVVEMAVYPVRARDSLVESLSTVVRQVQNMQAAMSVGIDGPQKPDLQSPALYSRFQRARGKAKASLTAAETFLPFCLNEPRLKGSFKPLEPVYREIVYVLHQIIDRLQDIMALRKAYGSSLLEDLNAHVYAYRRNVSAANMLVLFSVNEALTTWLPLPQLMPSMRLAQQRLIDRVRQVLEDKDLSSQIRGDDDDGTGAASSTFVTRLSFLAWNANAAGYIEVIEYLEELVELTKLLVGVNAFRSGLLEKPRYKDYVDQARSDRRAAGGLPELTQSKSAPAEMPPDVDDGGTWPAHVVPAAADQIPLRRMATTTAAMETPQYTSTTTTRTATASTGISTGTNADVRSRHSSTAAAAAEGTTPLSVPLQQQQHEEEENAVVDDEEFTDDELPMSLRRVGTRLRRESTALRKRGYSINRRMT
ncbi:Protein of unknown function (DUF2422) [Geosmithia morbida]|uniref:Integral membrane bound transporter domain-containing protein n=1 Tax=Geosmithia morbida TaxID=1094350 RepID=A0A9P4Z186_9HYPO|nr:Protein of unknown function (DUF2422) [Geosmithia morbida]KAF4126720.1 Protein of unknown function (DUF2422) [Geosmithia morbida]